jgi:hypothetical protein
MPVSSSAQSFCLFDLARWVCFALLKHTPPIPEAEWVRFFGAVFLSSPSRPAFLEAQLAAGTAGTDPSGTVCPASGVAATTLKRGVCVAWLLREFIGGLEIAGVEFGAIRFVCSTYGRIGFVL